VKNSVPIFDNQNDESTFSFESTKITLDNVCLSFNIDGFITDDKSDDYRNKINNLSNAIKEINSYFDTFVNKTILNWWVVIENVFKFDINQGRIVECICNLQAYMF
jgi:hypothetical protein